MGEYCLNIVHLYPDLLNLYGDKGNIECLKKRLLWRGIDVDVKFCTSENSDIDFENTDIFFLGGGTDREQKLVCEKLRERREDFLNFAENGGTIIAVCGGFEMIGKQFCSDGEKVDGIGILDIFSEGSDKNSRFTGNIAIESETCGKIVGFENHGGRMNIGEYTPLGKVLNGYGNDGASGYEGVIYKNITGTYIHGPLFPKNPVLCDKILEDALKHKYEKFEGLLNLNDELEKSAQKYVLDNLI